MACISSTNYVVLDNGAPTKLFCNSRFLRKGCLLSPFFFLLVIEGLSRMIIEAKWKGKITDIKISSALMVTHLLFVDDVMIFCFHKIDKWRILYETLTIFCLALGMGISLEESFFISIWFLRKSCLILVHFSSIKYKV